MWVPLQGFARVLRAGDQQQPQLRELYGGVEGAGARGGHGNIALVIAPVYFSAAVNELVVFMMISPM